MIPWYNEGRVASLLGHPSRSSTERGRIMEEQCVGIIDYHSDRVGMDLQIYERPVAW